MATIAKAMACPESGLEVRDRMWLKITIANAFIGTSVGAEGIVWLLCGMFHLCGLTILAQDLKLFALA